MPVSLPRFMTRLLCGLRRGAALRDTGCRHSRRIGCSQRWASARSALLVTRRVTSSAGSALGWIIFSVAAHDAIDHRIAACVDGTVRGDVAGSVRRTAEIAPSGRSSSILRPRVVERGHRCAGPTAAAIAAVLVRRPRSRAGRRSGNCDSSCAAFVVIRILAASTTKPGVWRTQSMAAAASAMGNAGARAGVELGFAAACDFANDLRRCRSRMPESCLRY